MSKQDRCPSPTGETPPAKVKRPDVAARKAAIKFLDTTVIKSTLHSFWTEEGKHVDWDGLFIDLNKTTIVAYLFTNFHVLRLCETGLPLSHIKQDFCYKCVSLLSTSRRGKPPQKDRELQHSFTFTFSLAQRIINQLEAAIYPTGVANARVNRHRYAFDGILNTISFKEAKT